MFSISSFFATVTEREPVVCAHMHGGGGGEAQDVAHTLLLEAVQRPRPSPSIRQHGLRLQSQPGHLPAGTRDGA